MSFPAFLLEFSLPLLSGAISVTSVPYLKPNLALLARFIHLILKLSTLNTTFR